MTEQPEDEELEFINGYMMMQWDCMGCGEINVEDHDSTGEDVMCSHCYAKFHVSECR